MTLWKSHNTQIQTLWDTDVHSDNVFRLRFAIQPVITRNLIISHQDFNLVEHNYILIAWIPSRNSNPVRFNNVQITSNSDVCNTLNIYLSHQPKFMLGCEKLLFLEAFLTCHYLMTKHPSMVPSNCRINTCSRFWTYTLHEQGKHANQLEVMSDNAELNKEEEL